MKKKKNLLKTIKIPAKELEMFCRRQKLQIPFNFSHKLLIFSKHHSIISPIRSSVMGSVLLNACWVHVFEGVQRVSMSGITALEVLTHSWQNPHPHWEGREREKIRSGVSSMFLQMQVKFQPLWWVVIRLKNVPVDTMKADICSYREGKKTRNSVMLRKLTRAWKENVGWEGLGAYLRPRVVNQTLLFHILMR